MSPDKIDIIHRVKQTVSAVDPLAKVILFGSRARGDAGKESDWDFLILVRNKKITRDVEKTFRNPLYEIELETDELISAIIINQQDWESRFSVTSIYSNVKNEGIAL